MSAMLCPLCTKAVSSTQIMCVKDWKNVPPPLKEEIRKFKHDKNSSGYKNACKIAIDYVKVLKRDELEYDVDLKYYKMVMGYE